MFGIPHCVTFRCVMNGVNSLDETDKRQPVHLCPLCLAKLAWNLGLNVRQRFQKLAALLTKFGLKSEAAWYQKQATRLAPRL